MPMQWPGNVRELENRIKRAVIMADGKLVTAADLDLPGARDSDASHFPVNLRAAREVADRRAIHQALTRTENNIQRRGQAARYQPADTVRFDEAVSAGSLIGIQLTNDRRFSTSALAEPRSEVYRPPQIFEWGATWIAENSCR